MPAAGARPKETKIKLMDCICLCSEVEIVTKPHCVSACLMKPSMQSRVFPL